MLSLQSKLEEASLRWDQTRERQAAAAEADRSSSAAWAATRASFRAGRSGTHEWTDSLARRVNTITMVVEAAEDTALSFLDAARAAGPVGGVR